MSDLNSVKLKSTSQTEPGIEKENETPKSAVLRKVRLNGRDASKTCDLKQGWVAGDPV